MEKLQNGNGTNHNETILTDMNGTQYFVMGKVRIKVSEHFAEDGKPIDCLLEDVIQHAATTT